MSVRNVSLATATGVLLAAALAASAAAAALAPEFELEAFRWRGEVGERRQIVAVNRWGDLRVRTAAHDELVVGAMIQRLGERDTDFAVRVEERGDAIVVEVRSPRRPRGRVDLTLIVPAGKRLRATTRDGLAEIKYRGDVVVRTRGGDITLEIGGHAQARSASGDIVARLDGAASARPEALVTDRGDVTLWLPDDAERRPRAESRHGQVRVVRYARAAR